MKLHPDSYDLPVITGLGPGWIAIGGERITQSLLLSSQGLRQPWDCQHFEQLEARHFAALGDSAPELVLFGSGSRLRFPRPDWLAPLAARRIGVETMDTAAACRTYNVLAGEGRHVLAALLLETP